MAEQNTAQLFSGKPMPFGGLTNEKELAQTCPNQFRDDNPWSRYAIQLFFRGGDLSNLEWKTEDKATIKHQLECFYALLGTFEVAHQEKTAVAGWMLSEMLTKALGDESNAT